MDNILTWSTRGLNSHLKQQEVRKFILSHNINLFSLFETRVKTHNMGKVYLNLCPGWCFTHNNAHHENGRIMVGWWPGAFQVNIVGMIRQYIHCIVKPSQRITEFWCTFLYGYNDCHSRNDLWTGLEDIASTCQGPWVVLGDFNAISCVKDRLGSPVRLAEIGPILECMNACKLVDIKASGRYYTSTNKQEGDARVFSRIDRVLVNNN